MSLPDNWLTITGTTFIQAVWITAGIYLVKSLIIALFAPVRRNDD